MRFMLFYLHIVKSNSKVNMQRCTSCGLEIPADARFCGHCGHVVADTIDTHAPASISELPTGSLSSSGAPPAPSELSHAVQPPIRKSTLRPDRAAGQSRGPRRTGPAMAWCTGSWESGSGSKCPGGTWHAPGRCSSERRGYPIDNTGSHGTASGDIR